ncbi:TPA: hypothetical protein N0F65_006086 [Lagenidium giganteum]|uniref:Calmodulin n=1 Tax=Lagenidium giganteum TaxID=4803 RepID=A0AAV2YKT6_9STRA|nr:TPA: hypothetical protein N0F65_006086 [Lagenidium giganteum]
MCRRHERPQFGATLGRSASSRRLGPCPSASMGGGASVDNNARMQTRSRLVAAFLNMANKPHHAPLVAAKTQWRISSPYGNPAEGNGYDQELINLLNDPVGQKHIGAFAKKILTAETFFCWVEIKEFREAPSIGYRKSMAKLIYKKYIKSGSTMALGCITSEMMGMYDKKIKDMETDPSLMTPEFFDPLMGFIVMDMYQNTFLRFKSTPEYESFKKEVKDTYNKVTVEDFEYLELLGSGGFGRVVHARKKSTGKHYAMKIQLKTGLLDEHHDQLSQITSEKDILQVCHNPFILDMHYSFQTPAHAIIVTELVRGGDLGEALKTAREGYLSEDRVRLYAAEIGLALNHMHELGLIYRDLKPGNVLLGEDGHVILADMGLAAGFDPLMLKRSDNGQKYTPQNPKLTRRKTTVGTRGYMAPEIISGKLVKRDQRPGYTFAVDYWSLGVTIFELMCGYQPFSVYSGGNFFQEVANEEIFRLSPRTQHKIELQKMAQGVMFPPHVTKTGQDFLKRLLEANPEERIACNAEKGFNEFMDHPFFETVDWEKLMVKHIDPKFKPTLPPLTDKKIYNSYEHMMSHFDMRDKDFIRHDWYADPDPEMQKFFDQWDYISQYTLRAELGIAKELEQTNIPYKLAFYRRCGANEEMMAKFKSIGLDKHQLFDLNVIFSGMDKDGSGEINVSEFFTYLDIPRSRFGEKAFSVMDHDGSGEVDFIEFVLAVWNYCSFSQSSLVRYAFDLYDLDGSGEIELAEAKRSILEIWGSSWEHNANAQKVLQKLETVMQSTTSGRLPVSLFQDFAVRHPVLLFPAFQLQTEIQEKVLGEKFWRKAAKKRGAVNPRDLNINRVKALSKTSRQHSTRFLDDPDELLDLPPPPKKSMRQKIRDLFKKEPAVKYDQETAKDSEAEDDGEGTAGTTPSSPSSPSPPATPVSPPPEPPRRPNAKGTGQLHNKNKQGIKSVQVKQAASSPALTPATSAAASTTAATVTKKTSSKAVSTTEGRAKAKSTSTPASTTTKAKTTTSKRGSVQADTESLPGQLAAQASSSRGIALASSSAATVKKTAAKTNAGK